MRRGKMSFIILIVLLFCLISGCQHKYINEVYKTKYLNNKLDENVSIRYFFNNDKGEVDIEFEKKEIPLQFQLVCDPQTSSGSYSLTGDLNGGSITVVLLSSDGKEQYERFTYNSGVIKTKQYFDLYGGNYLLKIEFNKAVKGKLKFKFQTSVI